MLKILHLLPSLNLYGGTPKKVLDLATNSEYQHIIFCWSTWEGKEKFMMFKKDFERQNVKIIEIFSQISNPSKLKLISELFRCVKQNNINVVHSYFELGQILGGLVKLRYPKVKLISAFVGANADQRGLGKVLVSLSHLLYSKIIYISEFVKASQQLNYPLLRILPSKIIFNGTYRKQNLRSIEIGERDDFKLITVSGLNKFKNVKVIIEAMHILKHSGRLGSIKLFIVGDGPLREELEELIDKYALNNCVNLMGYQKDIGAILNQADLYLHPSDFEGFGIAVIEAMRCGVPVLVSKAGALPEVVGHDQQMLVAPYKPEKWAESISSLKSDNNLRRKLAIKCYLRARKYFSVERYVNNHDSTYCEVFKSNKD